MDAIINKLNIARKELLDLSFRNPLLNFKLRKTTGLEFPNININDSFEYLVIEERSISFTREESSKPSRLQVFIDEKELHSRLNQTYRQATMFLEEKGANTLFLVLGFLQWYEDNVCYKSPLVLVPVELKKADNSDRFSLVYSSDDIKYNVTLATKLKMDYNINIEVDEQDDFDVLAYLRLVKDAIYTKENWDVLYTGALDFFSYGKYLMYQDLDIDKWIKDGKFINDKIINGLFIDGFNDKLTDLDAVDINEVTKPHNFYHVVDCDSSQALAIYDVNQGSNLVMQGPPGTGKSQTITNLIANAVMMGKSVLFVAEKSSALDVVYRRLKSVGLDSLALELHSHKANKRDILHSLEETINLGEPKVSDNNPLYAKYEETKDVLNKYKDAVNKPILNSHLTPLNIYGNILRLKDSLDKDGVRLPRISFKNILDWTDSEYQKRYDATKEYINVLKNVGKIEKHPFYGVGLSSCMPFEQIAIKEKIIALDDALISLTKIISEMQKNLNNHSADCIFEANRLSRSIDLCCSDFDIMGINSCDYRFLENPEYIFNIICLGQKGKKLYEDLKDKVPQESFEDYSYLDKYVEYDLISSLHKKKKKQAKEELTSYLYEMNNKTLKDLFEYLRISLYFKSEKRNIRDIFLGGYQGIVETDWDKVFEACSFIFDIHQKIASYQVIPQMKMVLMDNELMKRLQEINASYKEALENFVAALKKVMAVMEFDYSLRFGYPKWYIDYPFNDFKRLIAAFMDTDKIIEIVRYNEASAKMNELGIMELVELGQLWKGNYDYLADILEYERDTALIDYAFKEEKPLQEFKKYNHERQIEVFKDLDMTIMVENIKHILKHHFDNCPRINDNTPEMNILRREFQKKKNQMPIRKLLSKAGETIKAIKPVFMMSPLSIASYLEPGKMSFDLVVFDEASQVRPVEAFGALLRANQIVVVGDSHQLPPTNFFDTMTTKYEGVTDEDYDVSNMESILSLLLAKNIPERTLNWHYRSRHKSLIMISNKEFYDGRLNIFPSVDDLDINEGLIFNYLPKTVYLRGRTRTNPEEAKVVIKAALKHALEHPNQSLGIVSFSMAQADELYREFERQMKRNTSKEIENFFHMHETEPFFFKNLENVQGDERDVIFISVGYGHDENGYLSMDFGPLNKEGGERRLNVLITRARERTEIFSNITGYDINISKTQSLGVKALKKYLDYAQNRKNYDERNRSSDVEGFTDYIYNRLLEYGFTVLRNVGVPGFGIDLAIVDEKNPNRFLLGIECDGGAYSNFQSATDRDRLRNAVLTNLGWKIYHIWSTDFYRNPKVEFEKLLNYINNIRDVLVPVKQAPVINVKRAKAEKINDVNVIVDYKLYNGPKRRASILDEIETLSKLIEKIIEVEAPIHIHEIMRRIQGVTQVNKLTERMKKNILQAFELIKDNYEINDEFVYLPNMEIEVRRRSSIENKRMEFIPKCEIKEACYTVIDLGLATTIDEVKANVGEILGFNKTNPTLVKVVNESISELLEEKSIYIENDIYYINDYKDVQ